MKEIIEMRRKGQGYGAIAKALNLSINTVKSYCRRNHLTDASVCRQCGAPITQTKGHRRKLFCSDLCRNRWWNSHPELVKRKSERIFTCAHCGKEFTAYGHRKYCSHACYVKGRFHHDR